MSRVTPTEVRVILTTGLSDTVMQAWIDAASLVVDDNALCINGDDALLKEVELYLSAHLIAMLPGEEGGIITKEKLDVMETTFAQASVKKDINTTVYGKTANMLSRGCLYDTSDGNVTLIALGGD